MPSNESVPILERTAGGACRPGLERVLNRWWLGTRVSDTEGRTAEPKEGLTGSGSATVILLFHSETTSVLASRLRVVIQPSTSPVLTHRASVSGFERSRWATMVMWSFLKPGEMTSPLP